MFKRKAFTPRGPSTKAHPIFPSFETAANEAKQNSQGVIFYGSGFFALVWFENNIRYTRDLKHW